MGNQRGFSYSYPLRPNYELQSFYVWVIGGVMAFLMQRYATYLPPWPFRLWIGVCLAVALLRVTQGLFFSRRKARMERTPIEKIDPKTLGRKIKKGKVWLGQSFAWTPAAIQLAWDILKSADTKLLQMSRGHWIHGLVAKERDMYVPLELLEGHTLVVGSTGTGKTRAFDLLIDQAINRGEPVIIIDPKGDHELRENARKACEALGQSKRFVFFHPAFPEESIRLDPLRHFNEPDELASRVAALIPSVGGKSDPFKDFGWKAMSTVIQGLVFIGKKPSLLNLRWYVEGGVEDLLRKTLLYYYETYFRENLGGTTLKDLKNRYKNKDSHKKRHSAVQGLVAMHDHNREHFQKMIASLIPILSMLTSGTLQTLLSPKPDDSDANQLTDFNSLIKGKNVIYIGLNSLADPIVGSALGSIYLAAITAVASDRYNFPDKKVHSLKKKYPPVNVFIDEAAEVINDPTVQLLNKSRGAGFRVVVATQTLADLEVRTGTSSGARQIIGNINNWLILRIQDAETQKYISQALPKTAVKEMNLAYRSGSDTNSPLEYSTTYQESLKDKDIELFPAALLGILPNLHYFCRLSDGTTWKGKLPILEHERVPEMKLPVPAKSGRIKMMASQPGGFTS
jgi:conjugal transfer pilus assembly protein TraD